MHKLLIAGSTLLATVAVAYALEGRAGFTSTELFTWGQVRGSVQYDASFAGVRWADLESSRISVVRDPTQIATTRDGDLYLLVSGAAADGTAYDGLLHYDGTTFEHMLQRSEASDRQSGTALWCVATSPTTSGPVSAGDALLVERSYSGGFGANRTSRLVAVDPSTSPASVTALHTWSGRWLSSVGVSSDGTICVLDGTDEVVRTLRWNEATGAYDEDVLAAEFPLDWEMQVGPDGAVYAARADQTWTWSDRDSRDLLRIDVDDGTTTVHCRVPRKTKPWGWGWDASGALWVGLETGRDNAITEAFSGATLSTRDAVSSSGLPPYAVAGAPDGSLLVLELGADGAQDTVYRLAPGGGSGGGGNGKGKNK